MEVLFYPKFSMVLSVEFMAKGYTLQLCRTSYERTPSYAKERLFLCCFANHLCRASLCTDGVSAKDP